MMARNELYGIKRTSETTWRVQKIDRDFEMTGHYDISDIRDKLECTCFASNKPTCRHRQMIERIKTDPKFYEHMGNGGWFNFDKEQFINRINVDDHEDPIRSSTDKDV